VALSIKIASYHLRPELSKKVDGRIIEGKSDKRRGDKKGKMNIKIVNFSILERQLFIVHRSTRRMF